MFMEFWGDLGSVVGGFATAILVVVGLLAGLPGVRDWREGQRAQSDLAAEEAKQIRLERLRKLNGWSPGIVASFKVVEALDTTEIAKALDELTNANSHTPYILLRHTDAARANDFRQMLEREDYIGRVPTSAEYAALLAGRKELANQTSAQE